MSDYELSSVFLSYCLDRLKNTRNSLSHHIATMDIVAMAAYQWQYGP